MNEDEHINLLVLMVAACEALEWPMMHVTPKPKKEPAFKVAIWHGYVHLIPNVPQRKKQPKFRF